MAAVEDSDLSEQPSSSPSAGSTVPLPSSELGSPTDRDRGTSPRPTPSTARASKPAPVPLTKPADPKKAGSSSAAHSRHGSATTATTIRVPNRRKGNKSTAAAAASSSRAGSLATEGRASSVKAESLQSPTSRDGSLAPLVPAALPISKMSRVSSLADSPSPPHHLNTSHGELPLFEQPIILEGGRSRRTAPPLPPPVPASATRKKAGPPSIVTTVQATGARRRPDGSPVLGTAAPDKDRVGRGKKRAKKADATDGDSSLTEQDSPDERDEGGSSSSAGKGQKRRRAVIEDEDEDEEDDGPRPNGDGRAKIAESATSTSLSEAGSDSATTALAAPLTIGAGPSVTTTMTSGKRPSGGSTSSSSTSIPMRNVHRSPHAALFQGETARWGLPPGEGRARRGAAVPTGKSKLGKSESIQPTSPSLSGRSSRRGGGLVLARGARSKRRRVDSDSDGDVDEEDDSTAAPPTTKEDVDMADAPATPIRLGEEGAEDGEEAEATHFAMPQAIGLELGSSRPPSVGSDSSEGEEDDDDEDEAGPSPPTPLREDTSRAGSIVVAPVEPEASQKEEDDEDEEAVKTLAGLGVQGMVMDEERGAVDALQTLVDAATGSAQIVGPEDEEEEEGEDEEDEEAGEKADTPQVAPVETQSPTKARQARISPELTDAQDAYNVKRSEATERLARIEIAFAALRNRLYVERTADVLREKATVEAGVHPELNAYVEMLQHKRERRLEQARKRFDAREQALERRKTASEAAIWTMWNEVKVESRNAMVAQTHRELRQLEREKNQPEILRPYVESQLAPREILPGAPSMLPGARRKRTAEEREAEEEEDLAVALRLAVAGRAAADLSSLAEEDRLADLRRMAMRPVAGMDAAQAAREAAEITSLYGAYYPIDPMMSYALAAAVAAPAPPAPEPTAPHPPSQHAGPRPTGDSEKKHHRRPTLDTVMQQERPPRPSAFNAGPPAFYVPAVPPNPIRQY